MPPRLHEYRLEDWTRLRPLLQGYKTLRNRLVDRVYCAAPAKAGDPAAVANTLRGAKALITVAFKDPQAIDWQAQLVRRYVPDALYIVADNSPDDADADAIAAVAARHAV